MRTKSSGVILPVVMFVLILLGLLGAVFAFRVNADLSSTQVVASRMQTRLAAEAGVEWVKLMLRAGRFDQSLWYHNMDAFNRIVVWAYDSDATVAGTNDEFKDAMSFRFSIVEEDAASINCDSNIVDKHAALEESRISRLSESQTDIHAGVS